MPIRTTDESQRNAARVAGFTFLFAMAIVVLANYGISFRLSVPGNAAETARNIIANETLIRINIACNLLYGATIGVLLSALYVILKPVDRNLALVAAFCRLVVALMWGVTALNMLGALRLLALTLASSKPINCRHWRGCTSTRATTRTTLACRSGHWPPRFAATCGSSQGMSREHWLPSV